MRLRTSGEGYEYFVEERGGTPVYVHRLVAVAEYGFDAVTSDMDVHHKEMWDGRSVPFLNGRTLVEPVEATEHRSKTLKNVSAGD